MIINGTDIKYHRAPLPFVGQKRIYIKPFSDLIYKFEGDSIFDAFAGSGLLSRVAKDTRPDLDVYTNDIGNYQWRLSKVKETNDILNLMRANGACRNNQKYEKYSFETEQKLKKIVEKAADKETVYQSLYARHGISPRKKCRTVNYDERLCSNWYNGLKLTQIKLNEDILAEYIPCDLMILDPPYTSKPRSINQNDYIGDAVAARSFCQKVINSQKKYILFDLINSHLVTLAIDNGARIVSNKKKTKGMCAKDCMITNLYN